MYSIEWKENALRNLEKLDKSVASRIVKNVEEMQEDPPKKDVKKLKGSNLFRLRVGDYRVIFEIQNTILTVLKVGHRQQIYER